MEKIEESEFGEEEETELKLARDASVPEQIENDLRIHELLLNIEESNFEATLKELQECLALLKDERHFVYDIYNVFNKRDKNYQIFVNLLEKLNVDINKYIYIFKDSFLLRALYDSNLVTIQKITEIKPNKRIFWPEIYNLLKTEFPSYVQNRYNSYQENNFERLKNYYRNGYDRKTINYCLFTDNIQKFSKYSSRFNFDINGYTYTNWFMGKTQSIKLSYISFAALYGSIKCFKQLFLSGAQITQETMRCAIKGGDLELVRICLEHCNSLNIQNSLETALEYERNDILDFLLYQYNMEFPPLLSCTKYGNIRAILVNSNDVNNVSGKGNLTPLHYAVLNNDLLATKALVSCGIDINKASSEGRTALHIASLYGKADLVSFLLQNGTDFNIKTKDGETAREIALRRNNFDVMNIIDMFNDIIKYDRIIILSKQSISSTN